MKNKIKSVLFIYKLIFKFMSPIIIGTVPLVLMIIFDNTYLLFLYSITIPIGITLANYWWDI